MPKEVVHWGKRYIQKIVPETEKHQIYYEELPFEGRVVDPKTGLTQPLPEGEREARSPSLEVYWARPEEFSPAAYDEDPEGHVQIGMSIDRAEIDLFIKEIELHGENLTAHTFFTRAMTRYQINNTIKVLQRARDSALLPDA